LPKEIVAEGHPLTEYLTEQEQIEILKNWVKQYSLVILAGVAIAVLSITGWRYWEQRQDNILRHASAVYDEMLTMRAQNDSNATLTQAEKLYTHYSHTVYGEMSALMIARAAVLKKDYAKASEQYQWVIDHSKTSAIRQIARLRLARILIAQQKTEDALTILNKVEDKTFAGLIDEIRGDAYLATKNTSMAYQAYQKALDEIPNAEIVRPLLRMKLDNLTTTIPSGSV
jgi:predicted negative regulator of RcsB-dependent stress response